MKKNRLIILAFSFLIFSCSAQEKFTATYRQPGTADPVLSKFKTALLKTSMGTITISLHWDAAPATCTQFARLVKKGFYNKGIIFHRVIANSEHLRSSHHTRARLIQSGVPSARQLRFRIFILEDPLNEYIVRFLECQQRGIDFKIRSHFKDA